MSQRIALIPARGGSKRLPRKNILDFLGKPMIAYTIEAALDAHCFDAVVVSTEDDEIATIAEQYGATVDQRPKELATDISTVTDVCLEYLQRNSVSTLAVLYATAPLRSAEDIKSVVNLLSDDCDFSMAVSLCERPLHQLLKYQNGAVSPVFPDWVGKRSDEVGLFCLGNGSTYAVKVDEFVRQKTFYGHLMKAYLMPSSRSVDIDTLEDYDKAIYHAKKLFSLATDEIA